MSYRGFMYEREDFYGGGGGRSGRGYGGGAGGGGYDDPFAGRSRRREFEEPRQRGYVSYSNRREFGGLGNPFADMGDRLGGAMRGARNGLHAGLDRVGGWGQAMDDRFDRAGGFRGLGRRMGIGGRSEFPNTPGIRDRRRPLPGRGEPYHMSGALP